MPNGSYTSLKRCVLSGFFFVFLTVKWQLINCQMTPVDYCNCSQLEMEVAVSNLYFYHHFTHELIIELYNCYAESLF